MRQFWLDRELWSETESTGHFPLFVILPTLGVGVLAQDKLNEVFAGPIYPIKPAQSGDCNESTGRANDHD